MRQKAGNTAQFLATVLPPMRRWAAPPRSTPTPRLFFGQAGPASPKAPAPLHPFAEGAFFFSENGREGAIGLEMFKGY
jgi:hypothetical protein